MTDVFSLIKPSVLGKYYLPEKVIGKGRYSYVFLVQGNLVQKENGLHEQVDLALKIPNSNLPSSKRREMVLREAEFMQKTQHPNFVSYFDHGDDHNFPYLVMEYVQENVDQMIKKNAITQEVVLDYLKQIPEILSVLRKHKIAHLDLKCSNLGYHERKFKVLDFGLAIPFEHSIYYWARDIPEYCAPEFRYAHVVSPTSDTYSAGKALEFMLTGECADSIEDTLDMIELVYDTCLPNSFKQLLSAMLNEEHTERPSAARLRKLTTPAIADLEQRLFFSPHVFATIKFPEFAENTERY